MAERIEGVGSFFANWRKPGWKPGEVIDPDREMAPESLRALGREVAEGTRAIIAQRETAYSGMSLRTSPTVEMVPFQAVRPVSGPTRTEERISSQ